MKKQILVGLKSVQVKTTVYSGESIYRHNYYTKFYIIRDYHNCTIYRVIQMFKTMIKTKHLLCKCIFLAFRHEPQNMLPRLPSCPPTVRSANSCRFSAEKTGLVEWMEEENLAARPDSMLRQRADHLTEQKGCLSWPVSPEPEAFAMSDEIALA